MRPFFRYLMFSSITTTRTIIIKTKATKLEPIGTKKYYLQVATKEIFFNYLNKNK